MGLFGKILEKLGLKKPVVPVTPVPTAPTNVAQNAKINRDSRPAPASYAHPTPNAPVMAPVVKPTPIEVVDVVAKLEKLAKANPEKLDWKVSIVDLLKLLDLDSSLAARKELATELGCPPAKIGGDYSEMNVWLHKTVLQKIAENGGNIPQSLL